MSYVEQVISNAEKIRSSAPEGPLGDVQRILADEYEKEYKVYAKEADAYDPSRDNIQLFLTSFTLHKRQDAAGKTEFYYVTVVGNNGKHKNEPVVHTLEHYRQLKKGETWEFRDPLLIYEGHPKGEVVYKIDCFDTQRDNHDDTVKAASSIISAVNTAVVALVGGPAAVAVGAAVESVNKAITTAAIEHKDELFDIFTGSLTENDPFNVGPYSLASPKIKLETERITLKLQVVRVAGARGASRMPNRHQPRSIRISPNVSPKIAVPGSQLQTAKNVL